MKNILQKIIDYGLLSTLVIFTLSINIALISPDDPGHPLIAINLSLADIFIGLLLILWGVKAFIFKEWRQLKFPPTPILVFVGVILISFVKATSLIEWAKESVQMIEYFILFYFLLLNNFRSIERKTIIYTFYLSTSIILIMAFVQYIIIDADVYLIRGLFENRNFLGAYLCIAIPLIYAEFIISKKMPVKIWMATLLIISFIILVSGSAILAIVMSLGVVSWKYGKKILLRYSIFILTISFIYPFVFPEKNVNALKDFFSIYEQGSISQNYSRRLVLLSDFGRTKLFTRKIQENNLVITTDNYFTKSFPDIKKEELYMELEGKKHIKNRYLEMQASINLISENALLGVGAGNFQNHIGTYYNELPKVNTTEPGQHNGYLISTSTMGLLGLAALLWLFINLLSIRNYIPANYKIYGIGLYGAVLACMIENMFVYFFSAGLFVPFIFIVYLSLSQKKAIYAKV